jgi:hypothetical protein
LPVEKPEESGDATRRRNAWTVRDAVVQSGIEHGAAESYDKLAEILASMLARRHSQAELH